MAQGYGIGTPQQGTGGPKDPIGKFIVGLFKGKPKQPQQPPAVPGNGMLKQTTNAIQNRQRQLDEASK